ncbi:putative sulfate exporter family transporter [Mesorhizobium sp.]|uniref:putative sulfate exporter family transporter n=1 Tax=Mesorhizobium sp. TaxID=1871066 RepID=UPI000FE5D303|nr:MAG: putative sulfate exporter family transporter [Mesorhizobium sp.]
MTIAWLVATYFVTCWIGKRMGVDENLARLIAAGTAVCGASAILAVNGTKRIDEEHAVYAVACVPVLGTVSMLAVMTIGDLLELSPIAYGTWAGASLHEVAQVLGAVQHQVGSEPVATVVKLSRILFLPSALSGAS